MVLQVQPKMCNPMNSLPTCRLDFRIIQNSDSGRGIASGCWKYSRIAAALSCSDSSFVKPTDQSPPETRKIFRSTIGSAECALQTAQGCHLWHRHSFVRTVAWLNSDNSARGKHLLNGSEESCAKWQWQLPRKLIMSAGHLELCKRPGWRKQRSWYSVPEWQRRHFSKPSAAQDNFHEHRAWMKKWFPSVSDTPKRTWCVSSFYLHLWF